MLTDQQLEQKLTESPKPRVTIDYMKSRITKMVMSKLPFASSVTICHIELDNGYSVRGESACVNPENYNQEIAERVAYDDAFKKLWPLFGFLLAETGDLPRVETRQIILERIN